MPSLPDLNEIYKIRRKLNISQIQLSKNLDIPQATISRIERGIGNPSYLTVKKIFDYLDHEKLNRKELEKTAKDIMVSEIVFIDIKSKIKDAVNLMNKYNISQLPLLDEHKNLGSISAKKIQKTIIDNPELVNATVDIIKELPFPEIEEVWDIKDISTLLTNYSAVLVKKNNKYIGIITDADLLKLS